MPATFYVPGCQEKEEILPQKRMFGLFRFLGSPWGENSGSMQFVNTRERSFPPILGEK